MCITVTAGMTAAVGMVCVRSDSTAMQCALSTSAVSHVEQKQLTVTTAPDTVIHRQVDTMSIASVGDITGFTDLQRMQM
jgi:hypothetical protein